MLAQFIPLYCVLVGGAFGAGLRAVLLAQRLRSSAAPPEPAPEEEPLVASPESLSPSL